MNELLVLAAVFIGTVGVLIGAYLYYNRKSLSATDAVLERLRKAEAPGSTGVRSILRDMNVSELPALDRLLAGRGFTAFVAEEMQKAGLVGTPASFLLRMALSTVFGFVIAFLFSGGAFGALGALGGFLVPVLWLKSKQKKRIAAFREQLPEALDMLVSAMKAGYSFQAAMRFIGEEVKEPLGPEFSRFYEEQRLGMEVRTALLALQARVDLLDLKMFVTAVLIQRETGGNLSEVLDNISTLMRERAALKGEIETLTAESKMSARILSLLPLAVFIIINVINPQFMRPMLGSTFGLMAFGLAAVMVLIGYTAMMKIADIDI
jgi:tight adherence protein B